MLITVGESVQRTAPLDDAALPLGTVSLQATTASSKEAPLEGEDAI